MRGILFDMDGVLYNAEEPIEGAAEALAWVRQNAIPYLFVTNTTSRSRDVLVQKLARLGMPASRDRILTPCVAAVDWLHKQTAGKTALFVAPKALAEFQGLAQLGADAESGADYVVIGDLGDAWNYHELNRAFRLLHSNPKAVLIALGMTPFWHAHDGLRLDVAPFVAALEHATGRKAVICGKPDLSFFLAAVEQLGLPAHEVLMIGDGIETDIDGAQKAGLKGALVRTGKFRPTDLDGTVVPDLVLNSIAELPERLQISDSRFQISE